jgi:hypothetical protein
LLISLFLGHFSHVYLLDLRFDLRALESAAATACFCGYPSRIIFLMFFDTVLRLLPLASGMVIHRLFREVVE